MLLILVLCSIFSITCAVDNVDQSADTILPSWIKRIRLEHSLNEKDFDSRGSYNGKLDKYMASEPSSSPDDLEKLKMLVKNNGLYRIQIRSNVADDSGPFVSASIPVCELVRSGYREEIVLYTSPDNEKVVGISYSSPVIALSRSCDASKITSLPKFQTKIKVGGQKETPMIPVYVSGPKPSNLAHVKMDVEAGAGDGKEPAQQSLMMKYWYIVLPMTLFVLFGGGGGEVAKDADGKPLPADEEKTEKKKTK